MMAKRSKKYLQVKASVKYFENDDEWRCSSSVPEIIGEKCSDIDKAIENFELLLRDYLSKKHGISPEEIVRAEKKIKCSDARFVDDDDPSVLTVDLVDLRISLTYRITEKVNHELTDFEKIPDLLTKIAQRPDGHKILNVVTKINEISEEFGVSPIAVFNHAMSQLNRQKEECEAA
jgi:hypothetical protein